MKKYIYIGVASLIAVLSILLITIVNEKMKIEKKWKEAVENVKSYSELFNNSESKNKMFKLTIDQLKYSNDSVFSELNAVRKELGIKDSKLQSLQHISSDFSKTDTIILKDTLFKDPQIFIDTTLCDKWYSLHIGLKYPSTITVTPSFKSNKSVIVYSKRETINPPKKFFLFRWFQKKHTVLNIDVVEKNPYVKNQKYRYVEIIK